MSGEHRRKRNSRLPLPLHPWRTNYGSCHGCSFVDGVFIPMRKSPITSWENCLSPGRQARAATAGAAPCTAAATLLICGRRTDVSITAEYRKAHPLNGTYNQQSGVIPYPDEFRWNNDGEREFSRGWRFRDKILPLFEVGRNIFGLD